MPHLKTTKTLFMLIDTKGCHIADTTEQAKPEPTGKFKSFEFEVENGILQRITAESSKPTLKDARGFPCKQVTYAKRGDRTTIQGAMFFVGNPWEIPSTNNADLYRLFGVSEGTREAA